MLFVQCNVCTLRGGDCVQFNFNYDFIDKPVITIAITTNLA
jgi:hypothetical protein